MTDDASADYAKPLAPVPPETVRSRRALWTAALRDAESYPQTRGCLRDRYGFCCLGVAEDVRDRPWVSSAPDTYRVRRPIVRPRELRRFRHGEEDQVSVLTGETAWWYGFVVGNPLVVWRPTPDDRYVISSLADLNDTQRLTLREIADVIDDQSPGWDGSGQFAHADRDRRAGLRTLP